MTLGGYGDLRIRDRRTFAAFGWRDQPSPAMVRSEDTMESLVGGAVLAKVRINMLKYCDREYKAVTSTSITVPFVVTIPVKAQISA
ncbi:MAG: hypothetical protein ACI9JM_002508 [Halioglobus sp.]|jgi:hypothetical protein